MAHSLFGERSVAAGSSFNPVRALARWIKNAAQNHRRRKALVELAQISPELLRDMGITQADLAEARKAKGARTSGMVLHAARARNSRL